MPIELPIKLHQTRPMTPAESPYGQCGRCHFIGVEVRLSTLHIWWARRPLAACPAAEITPKLKAAAKTNPNVRLVEYGVRLELSPKG